MARPTRCYDKVAMVVMVIGYELDLLTLLTTSLYYVSRDGAVEAMFIMAFLFYSVAAILVVILNLTDLREHVSVVLTTAALSFLAALFIVIGLSVHSSDHSREHLGAPSAYSTTTYSASLVLSLVGGLFLSLHLTGLKSEGPSLRPRGSVGSSSQALEVGK